ncbi:UNVERIFIED_CONTAM: hypothetical protein RMT77_018492 [Armadillidium vulgare]
MVSRLEDLCGIQMAIEFANKLEVKKEILRLPDLDLDDSLWYDESEPWFENMEKKVLDELKKLPFGLRGKIPIPVVIFCLTQSMEWAKLHNEEFDLPFDYSCSFLRSSFFTSKGILKKEKAAREILKDTELSPSLKFCIACHYCFSDVIPALWEQLPEDKRPKVENGVYCNGFRICGRNELADIWSYFLLGELQIIMKNTDCSFSFYKFKKIFKKKSSRNCSDVAFKKCFEELNEPEKKKAVIFTSRKLRRKLSSFGRNKSDTPHLFHLQLLLPFQKYLEIAIFFLRNLDERQLKVFFKPVTLHYLLFHSLSWPYQHMFMDVVSQFWEVLPKLAFSLLLHQIVSLMKNKWSSKFCDYHNILRDFWMQSSSSLKRFFFRLEKVNKIEMLSIFTYQFSYNNPIYALISDFEDLDSPYVICELFDSPFTIEEKIIRLILSSATLKEKSDIVKLQGSMIGKISFEACDLRKIDLFIECCVPKGRIESFKKELFNDRNVKEVLFFLVLDNKGKEFQKILNWAFSAEEIKEWLINLLLYVIQERKLTLYTFKEIKFIDKSLEWVLSEEECKDFKRQLAFNEKVIEYYSKFVAQRKLSEVDAFIRWAELTETEMKNFKILLVFNVEGKIFSSCVSFILNGKQGFVKKLLKWTQFSKREVREFYSLLTKKHNLYTCITKKNTKLKNIKEFFNGFPLSENEIRRHKKDLLFKSLKLIKYFVMENRWDEMEELLGWCFSSKTEIIEFKKKIPLKISNICLNLILCQRFDDINKFFTWTGIHNSLKKKLLKKIMFDSRVYQIVLRGMYDINNRKIEGLFNLLSSHDLLSNKWKSSFLTWYYECRKPSICSDAHCFNIGRPENREFEVQIDYYLCGVCRGFIEDSKIFIKLFDKHKNIKSQTKEET